MKMISSLFLTSVLVATATAQNVPQKMFYLTNSCFYSSAGMMGLMMPRFMRSRFDDQIAERLKSEAESGSPTAKNELGLIFISDAQNETEDADEKKSLEKQAFECFMAASEKGNIVATYNIANCYEFGVGTEKNIGEATKIFQKLKKLKCGYLMPERVVGKQSSPNNR